MTTRLTTKFDRRRIQRLTDDVSKAQELLRSTQKSLQEANQMMDPFKLDEGFTALMKAQELLGSINYYWGGMIRQLMEAQEESEIKAMWELPVGASGPNRPATD